MDRPTPQEDVHSNTRPNILLIVSDDHGYADRSALGIDPKVRTPHLDRIASRGVSFSNAYVTAPICSASRAALVAGLYQQRWGSFWFDDSAFAPVHIWSIAEHLSALGYATGYFGKVHYGKEVAGDRACPPRHGFHDAFYGLSGHSMGRLHYLHHSKSAEEQYGEAASYHGVSPMLAGERAVEHEGHLTAELARRARQFMADHQDDPFFCMVAFNAVHNFNGQLPDHELAARRLPPFADFAPNAATYSAWYDAAIWPNDPHGRDYYRAQLELMDAEIGALLDELHNRGLAENTIVVYTTDNGGSTCNYGDNTPLRGGKYTLFEGGIRVPFLVRWTGGAISQGGVRDALVSTLDLLPTFVSAAGGSVTDVPACDGIDLLPVLREEPGYAHDALHFDCGFQWALRTPRWKLHWADGGSRLAGHLRRVEHTDIGDGLMLRDILADPAEQIDLSEAYPSVVANLTALHEQWRTTLSV